MCLGLPPSVRLRTPFGGRTLGGAGGRTASPAEAAGRAEAPSPRWPCPPSSSHAAEGQQAAGRGQVGTCPPCSGRCRPLGPFLQEALRPPSLRPDVWRVRGRADLSAETEGGEGLGTCGHLPICLEPPSLSLQPRLLGSEAPAPGEWHWVSSRGEAEPSWGEGHLSGAQPLAAQPCSVLQAVCGRGGARRRQGSASCP